MRRVDVDVLARERKVLLRVVARVGGGVEDGEGGFGDPREPFLDPAKADGSLGGVAVRWRRLRKPSVRVLGKEENNAQ